MAEGRLETIGGRGSRKAVPTKKKYKRTKRRRIMGTSNITQKHHHPSWNNTSRDRNDHISCNYMTTYVLYNLFYAIEPYVWFDLYVLWFMKDDPYTNILGIDEFEG
ncbi:transmembrane protein, putative [Medicago truncatula]|uniref:Transmembrane protein, putative n=1 Tax=Medicago truncatula TaxID=3880 RepID=G7L9V4_MEDTR|nr:transmembrane protein, putative [Medicago truncatula]